MLRPDYYQLNQKGKKQTNYIVSGNYYLDTIILNLYSVFSIVVSTVRPYRDYLPPSSTSWKALHLYIYIEGFIAAAQKEYNTLKAKNIFHIRSTPSGEKPILLI